MATPLLTLLRACESKERRSELAQLAGTDVSYLYQVAGCVRPNPSAKLAIAIEDASRTLHEKYGTPIVTVRELATMCALRGL